MNFNIELKQETSNGIYHVNALCATEINAPFLKEQTTDIFRAGLCIFGDDFLMDKECRNDYISDTLNAEIAVKIKNASRKCNDGKSKMEFYDKGHCVYHFHEITK